jgi:hypothetical protein
LNSERPPATAPNSTGELILDDSKHYTGTISGFGTNTIQSIDLTDIDFASATESWANGTLTIKDSLGDVAHIKFIGSHTLASFNFADDGQGGVLITDPPVQSKAHSANIALLANYMATSFVDLGGLCAPCWERLHWGTITSTLRSRSLTASPSVHGGAPYTEQAGKGGGYRLTRFGSRARTASGHAAADQQA